MNDFVTKLNNSIRELLMKNAEYALSNQIGFVYQSKKGLTCKLKGVGDHVITPEALDALKYTVSTAGGRYVDVPVSLGSPSKYELGNKTMSITLFDVPDGKAPQIKSKLNSILVSASPSSLAPQATH